LAPFLGRFAWLNLLCLRCLLFWFFEELAKLAGFHASFDELIELDKKRRERRTNDDAEDERKHVSLPVIQKSAQWRAQFFSCLNVILVVDRLDFPDCGWDHPSRSAAIAG